MCIQCIGLDLVVEAVDGFQQRLGPHGSSLPQRETLQHQQLSAREPEYFACDPGLTVDEVDFQSPDDEHRQRDDVERPAGNRTNAREQLLGHKWLGQVIVGADIKADRNTGSVTGAEVPQLYLTLTSAASEAAKRLVGFDKITLSPGERKTVQVVVDSGASNHPFSIYSEAKKDWTVVNGNYTVSVGGSSRDLPLTESVDIKIRDRR